MVNHDIPVDLRDVVNALDEIKNALPSNAPVVVGALPADPAFPYAVTNGIHHHVIALVVWSTGIVTPVIKTEQGVAVLEADDFWHYSETNN